MELYCLHNWSGADTQFAAQNGQMLDNTQSRFHADLVCSRQLHATVDHLLLLLFVAATTTSIQLTVRLSVCLSTSRPVDHHNKRATLMRDCTVNWGNEIIGCQFRMLDAYAPPL